MGDVEKLTMLVQWYQHRLQESEFECGKLAVENAGLMKALKEGGGNESSDPVREGPEVS